MSEANQVAGKYRLVPVFGRVDEATAARVTEFWVSEGVLPGREIAEERVSQVVYLVENDDSELVGVTTAYIDKAPRLGQPFYFYRNYLRASDRVPGLAANCLAHTYRLVREQRPAGSPAGMMIVAENPKLDGPAAQRRISRLGFRHLGRNPKGQGCWLRMFDQTRSGNEAPKE